MKNIFTLIAILIAFSSTAQPVLYGLTSRGGQGSGTIVEFKTSDATLSAVHTFQNGGLNPYFSRLVQAADGKLYGCTPYGGANGYGVILSFDPVTRSYSVVKSFTDTDGGNPFGGLTKGTDGKLYGMTSRGGLRGFGVIFVFDPATQIFTKLRDFDLASGGHPQGGLLQASDGKLYGMTFSGGFAGQGVIFSFDPVSATYRKLQDFNQSSGFFAYGDLFEASDKKLYGMTSNGGATGNGTMFSFDPVALSYNKLKDFNQTDGTNPFGSLMQASDGKLYGYTVSGGSANNGVVFSYNIINSSYSVVKHFNSFDGRNPYGRIIQAPDEKLYGITSGGGVTGSGVIFSLDISTNSYTILKNIAYNEGSSALGGLMVASDGRFYGMTQSGGIAGFGVLFSFDPSNSGFSKLYDFNAINGSNPYGGLTRGPDRALYGMTYSGGNNGYGVLFSFDPASSAFTKHKEFKFPDEGNAYGGLLLGSDGIFYGTTHNGGIFQNGTIFSFNPSNGVYTKLKDFNPSLGGLPFGDLIEAGNGRLYGMSNQGGANGLGVIYSFDPSTSVYAKLKDFTTADGSYPRGRLLQATDGKLYGMTPNGGLNGTGVLFSFNPSTLSYTKLKDFTPADGNNPYGSLIQLADGKLYGLTSRGGANGYGVIFSFDISTSTYSRLKSFTYSDGASPLGTLMQASDGKLYGMSQTGGTKGKGVVFSYDPLTSTYTKLQDFTEANGAEPNYGALTEIIDVTTITTTPLMGSEFCAGQSIRVPFVVEGHLPANNELIVQLSTATGDFGAATEIARMNGSQSDSIDAVIPLTAQPGSNYRLRVISTDQNVTSIDNGQDFSIHSLPNVSISPVGSTNICPNGFVELTASPANSYTWSTGATSQSIYVNTAGGYQVTVTDLNHCSATSDSIFVTVMDTMPPVIVTREGELDMEFETTGESTDITVALALNPEAIDNCSNLIPRLVRDTILFDCGTSYTRIREWHFTDESFNTSNTFRQVIRVLDRTAPIVYAPADMHFESTGSDCGAFVSFDYLAVAADVGNGNVPVAITYSHSPGLFPLGQTAVTVIATDACGNVSSATFLVTVVDTTPPLIETTSDQQIETEPGICGAYFTEQPNATDICQFTFTGERTDGLPLDAIYPVGTTTITWKAVDLMGNQRIAVQNVTVISTTVEICNGVDDNCDGQIDEGFTDEYFPDNDGDGAGDSNAQGTWYTRCNHPTDYVDNNRDCNDNDPTIYGDGREICDNKDNNCDGQIDESLAVTAFFRDADGDGFGNPAIATATCGIIPPGYVSNNSDCNDNDATVYPGAPELCDGKDNNCNATTDEGFSLLTFYRDADGDGYGATNMSIQACSQPSGYVILNEDCDDQNPSRHPNAIERCDGIDNNCDSRNRVDESCTNAIVPIMTIDDVQVFENAGLANITVRLSIPATARVTVSYATLNGTAMYPADFTARWGNISIARGQSTAVIQVPIANDGVSEGSEYFNLQLASPNNADLIDNVGVVTIRDVPVLLTTINDKQQEIMEKRTEKASIVSKMKVNVLPNPSSHQFTLRVQSDVKAPVTILVIDAIGRTVEKGRQIKINNEINFGSALRPGVYYLVIIQGNERVTQKIIKVSH